jgi:hypothetical protein
MSMLVTGENDTNHPENNNKNDVVLSAAKRLVARIKMSCPGREWNASLWTNRRRKSKLVYCWMIFSTALF